MNILIVSPKFHPIIGGGETFVLNLARMLTSAGHSVTVAVEPVRERIIESYDFEVFEINGLSDSELNINNVVVELAELIENVKPDVIHVHGYFALLAIGLCNERNIPIVASIHSTPVWSKRIVGNMYSFEAELTFARSVIDAAHPAILTAANDVYAEAAEKISEGRVPVVTIPYPVDLNYFYNENDRSMRSDLGLNKDDILLVLPSRIIERKGIKEAIFALQHLPDNVFLCLPAAVSPLDKKYWNEIIHSETYKKLKHRVKIPKVKLLYDQMPLLYAAGDIVIMPSYYEGAPVATVEAMTSGKPFIGADAQGINSFIKHGINGLLVPQKTISELAKAIQLLIIDKEYGNKLSVQARADVSYLDWKKQLPELLSLYKNATVRNRSKKSTLVNK